MAVISDTRRHSSVVSENRMDGDGCRASVAMGGGARALLEKRFFMVLAYYFC